MTTAALRRHPHVRNNGGRSVATDGHTCRASGHHLVALAVRVGHGRELVVRAAHCTPPRTDGTAPPTLYRVVVNAEDQCSIWSAARELPLGWKDKM